LFLSLSSQSSPSYLLFSSPLKFTFSAAVEYSNKQSEFLLLCDLFALTSSDTSVLIKKKVYSRMYEHH